MSEVPQGNHESDCPYNYGHNCCCLGNSQDTEGVKALSSKADNRCVICGEVRENMKPLSILENDPEAVGGVCNELYLGYSEFYPEPVPCYMVWHRRAAEKAMKRERSKWPTGRPPTEIEKLTDAVKELTQELATWRPKTRRAK